MRGMWSRSRRARIGILVAVLSAGARLAESAERPDVHVRVALDAPPPAAARHAAGMIAEADAIWRPLGVSVALSSSNEVTPGDVRLTVAFEATAYRHASDGRQGLGGIWFDE